jgi:hypothetical protein
MGGLLGPQRCLLVLGALEGFPGAGDVGGEAVALPAQIVAPAPAPDTLLLRGGPDTVSLLRNHARRTQRLYCLDGVPLFGIFCVRRARR